MEGKPILVVGPKAPLSWIGLIGTIIYDERKDYEGKPENHIGETMTITTEKKK